MAQEGLHDSLSVEINYILPFLKTENLQAICDFAEKASKGDRLRDSGQVDVHDGREGLRMDAIRKVGEEPGSFPSQVCQQAAAESSRELERFVVRLEVLVWVVAGVFLLIVVVLLLDSQSSAVFLYSCTIDHPEERKLHSNLT